MHAAAGRGTQLFLSPFIEVLKDRTSKSFDIEPDTTSGDYLFGFLQGTRKALYDNARESITLTIPEVNAHTVGGPDCPLRTSRRPVCSLVNVNAYHQPGVEAGKKAAATILNLQQAVISALRHSPNPLTLKELALKAQAPKRSKPFTPSCAISTPTSATCSSTATPVILMPLKYPPYPIPDIFSADYSLFDPLQL